MRFSIVSIFICEFCILSHVNFIYLQAGFLSDDFSELNGVWGEELFESDDKKRSDMRSERVFLSPIVLVLFLQKVQNSA